MQNQELPNISSTTLSNISEVAATPSIEKIESHGAWYQAVEPLPSINAEELFHVGPLTVANSTMFLFLAIFSFIILAFVVRKFSIIPTKFQHLMEMLYEGLLSLFSQIVGDKEKTKKIMPYSGAIFLYIIFSNLVPMLPGLTAITYHHVPVFRGGTADFNTTFGLALAAIVFVQYQALKERGVFSHLGHFIQVAPIVNGFKKSLGEGFIGIIHFMVGLIEIVGEFAKIISLSLRLFGNMFAHEVLTIVIMGAFAIILPAVWMGFGIIVGLVQALVFTALITVYYSLTLDRGGDH